MTTRWAILTGEYPPQPGGVSDYTQLIAAGLATAGDSVTVYAPRCDQKNCAPPGIEVRRLPDHFGPRGLLELDRRLRCTPRPDRILVQYVPHAYGWKAMNLPFATWVHRRASRIAPVWVMFHEVMAGAGKDRPVRDTLLSTMTRQMARLVAWSAERIFVSIPSWAALLRQIAYSAVRAEWLPVPSNLPTAADPLRTAEIRKFVPGDSLVIGHFGMFGGMNVHLLLPAIVPLLSRSSKRFGLFVGRGSQAFCERLAASHPDLAGRIAASGELPAAEAAAHLAVCDVLIQPYPDGISSRRGSAMAGLALGVPVVTNSGFLSEPIWNTEARGVTIVGSADPALLAAAAEHLLARPREERATCGRLAADWYTSQFAPERTISRLRSPSVSPCPKR